MLIIAVFFGCVVLTSGGRSPNADYIEKLLKDGAFTGRISDNVVEDATLDLPDVVRKYNYPFEEHSVTTEDGYILEMHRIPYGRDSNNMSVNRPVVFAVHGLLSSSADFIIMGPGSALAYVLADEGYDVWMGNARGNYFSRKHTNLDPDSPSDADFWKFSWDEIGNIDVPAMIDYVLNYTGKSALHYVGFSQGTTAFFVMLSLRPEYNEKIISMHALAPVAYMAHNTNPLLLALAPFARNIEALASLIGIRELLPNSIIFEWAGQSLCSDGVVFQPICSSIIFLIAGWNPDQHNATMLPAILGHTPAGAAVRQLVHYGQSISGKEFQRFDFGTLQNLLKYGTTLPPSYDLTKITIPVYLYHSGNDPFSHINDVDRLFDEIGSEIKSREMQLTFSHLDFIWGIDVKTLVYDKIVNVLQAMNLEN